MVISASAHALWLPGIFPKGHGMPHKPSCLEIKQILMSRELNVNCDWTRWLFCFPVLLVWCLKCINNLLKSVCWYQLCAELSFLIPCQYWARDKLNTSRWGLWLPVLFPFLFFFLKCFKLKVKITESSPCFFGHYNVWNSSCCWPPPG